MSEEKEASLLSGIGTSSDLKALPPDQLELLCAQLRAYILEVVSLNGGHLSSNLGVIELSVALEYVFDTSLDRLVWDVGHQSYAHKILTGRKEAFKTLRQEGGISGFPKRAESISDPYDTGHSSTSIAAALGFAHARDMRGEKHKVIALIGDGSMTGGQAFEALNFAAELDTDILVILNDNHMSIAPNIGGLSRYLTRLRSSSAYTGSKQAVKSFLARIPLLGGVLVKLIEAVKDSLRYIMVNGVVFSELGFQYYGPVDGHDVRRLVETLEQVKELKGPVLLHVVTQKGRGYVPAVEDATAYHGIAPFDLETGKRSDSSASSASSASHTQTLSYTEAFSQALLHIAQENPDVIAVTAAMADGTGLETFRQVFPDRFFDTGIAEQTAVTFSTALALSGLKPVVAIYSSFLQRAFDQLIQDTALQNAPVVFAIDRSGLVGEDGPTHHGVFDLSYLNQIPNMAVMLPRDEFMLGHMLRMAILRDQRTGPIAIRYPRGQGKGDAALQSTEPGEWDLPLWGKGQLVYQGRQTEANQLGKPSKPGKQALIIAAGPLVYEALAAAQSLETEGYFVAVFDPCFLKPIDQEGIGDAAKQRDLVLVAEENVPSGGLGQTVARALAAESYQGKIRLLSVPDAFVPQGSQKELRSRLGLDAQGMVEAIREELR